MFGQGRSIKLLSVAGVRVGADLTWFVMLFLLIFLLSGPFQDALHTSSLVAYATTVATALLFAASVIVHELGHVVASRREGMEVDRIELFLFGGFTPRSREALTPGEEFKVAIAGPLGTLAVIVVFVAIDMALVGPHRLIGAIELDSSVRTTPVLLSLSWLIPMNVLILGFNLLPAYPLDGGVILRAGIWKATGDKLRATSLCARIGQWFALALGGFGLWLVLAGNTFAGIWLALLAFLMWQGASSTARGTAVTARVRGVRVADIMDHEPVYVATATPAGKALEEGFLRYRAPWLPVVDGAGRFVGISRRYRVEELANTGDSGATVETTLETDELERIRVDQDRQLTDVLSLEALGRMGALVAVDGDGVLRGVLTAEQVRRAMRAVLSAPART